MLESILCKNRLLFVEGFQVTEGTYRWILDKYKNLKLSEIKGLLEVKTKIFLGDATNNAYVVDKNGEENILVEEKIQDENNRAFS